MGQCVFVTFYSWTLGEERERYMCLGETENQGEGVCYQQFVWTCSLGDGRRFGGNHEEGDLDKTEGWSKDF